MFLLLLEIQSSTGEAEGSPLLLRGGIQGCPRLPPALEGGEEGGEEGKPVVESAASTSPPLSSSECC